MKQNRPRNITVLLPDPQFCANVSNKEQSLVARYQKNNLSGAVIALKSREPQWNPRLQANVLDFHGRVTVPSVQNFILICGKEKEDIVLFGKTGEEVYSLDFGWPVSVFQAFSIGISSIAYKFGCE